MGYGAMEIKSSAFQNGGQIPQKYTCDGEDISPELSWTGAPSGTKSFALISDDPDAPGKTWVHWVIFDIPASLTNLAEAVSKTAVLENGAKQGTTDFGTVGYGGPCPPPGKPHRYFFKLYALDQLLDLEPEITKNDLLTSIKSHVLDQAELVGLYGRQKR